MTTNAYVRLRALLPTPPLLFGKVIAQDEDDDTSTIELPGPTTTVLSSGISVGSTITARGRTVPIGSNAFVRDGFVESKAFDGELIDVEIGLISSQPFGGGALVYNGGHPPAATVGVAYSYNAATLWSGGFLPLSFSLGAGTLPPDILLHSVTGMLFGTRVGSGGGTGIVITCTDSTGASSSTDPFNL